MRTVITGIIASPGIKIGRVYLYRGNNIIIPKYTIGEDQVEDELKRYHAALEKTKNDILDIQEQISKTLSRDMVDIFSSHLMVLEDPIVAEKVMRRIREEKRNAEWIINDISLDLIKGLGSIEDVYLRERIIDISDINKRLVNNLQKTTTESLKDLKEEVIVFATDLTPSDTAMMNKRYVLAFVTDSGGRTSHTAIMARALEIPAIVGTLNGTELVLDGDMVIVDAIHGKVVVDPTPDEIAEYTTYQEDLVQLEAELAKLTHLPSTTIDNEVIHIYGNIEIPEEMEMLRQHGAQGIGLFRSEFLFLDKALPDEERQFQAYKKVLEYFKPMPVTIRTLDVGGDKIYAYNKQSRERNPFLGCRAIRFSLENESLFRTQLRAILRASEYGNAKLMFPMISTIEEIIKARAIVHETMDELRREKVPFNREIPLGMMIEVPSAAINADKLAHYADFFSIGTNDLVQYTIAVDRISEKIAYLYNPLNLAVLRLLKSVVEIANSTGTPISICGEMAGEPKYTMLLLGLGLRNFSMGTAFMYQIKRMVRSVKISECEKLVEDLMDLETTIDIESHLIGYLNKKFPMMVF
ncbi:MAG: phosphoenolpyruvate--protein phosphotransferase [Spirochaetes bacterium]|nr:MAG: phosphoenolpyruvate--protein phosphotransferase [Spirochaetota bacterium]